MTISHEWRRQNRQFYVSMQIIKISVTRFINALFLFSIKSHRTLKLSGAVSADAASHTTFSRIYYPFFVKTRKPSPFRKNTHTHKSFFSHRFCLNRHRVYVFIICTSSNRLNAICKRIYKSEAHRMRFSKPMVNPFLFRCRFAMAGACNTLDP